jgi:WS/DGAT/MGAT family acyltransferase
MSKIPLSSVDTAWLRMEDPTNLMMITGVMMFGAPIDIERLKLTLEQRLLCFERFQQRVIPSRLPGCGYAWETDSQFNLDDHVQLTRLPQPGDEGALFDVVSLLMSTPLDRSKPLWEVHLVEQYAGGSALIARLHHCIADGIALVRVLLSLTDAESDASWIEANVQRAWDSRPGRAASLLKRMTPITAAVTREGREFIEHPSRWTKWLQAGTAGAAAAARLALRPPDPKTLFKGELGTEKRVSWSDAIALEDVKRVGRGIEATVNDVLLTTVTGALRRYLIGRQANVDGLNVRAVVPVNLRPLDAPLKLGNKFGLVFLSLPVFLEDPIERLWELKRRMDEIKDTPEAVVAFGILGTIGMLPSQAQDLVVDIFGTKGTAVMTNVPGPQETVFLAGAPLESMMFWVPQSGHLGMGVSIISYVGEVRLGVATDCGLVPDPDTIIAHFETEFQELATVAAGMGAREKEDAPGRQQPSTKELMRRLDDTIARVSDLIEARRQTVQPSRRCQALTQAGRRCKNPARPDSRFCHVHQRDANA